ncbi:ABC transporter permease [Parapusillimonas sp. SGNA-6]|nr:ABC transporter permease [Parapusillimonas sp. SGNA-6]
MRPALTKTKWLPWALSAPSLITIAGLVLVPLGLLTILSFQKYSATELWTAQWTLEHYSKIATDSHYLSVLMQTIRIGLITTLCCVVLGYPVAYQLAHSRGTLRGLCLFLLLCPLLVSTVIRTFGWVVLLGNRGIINQLLEKWGLPAFKLLGTEAAVVLGMTHFLLPFLVLPLMASIERVPKDLEAAAQNLGSNRIGAFIRVILPLSVPGLVVGSMLVYAMTISAVITPVLMGGRKVHMLGPQIYEHVLVTYNWPLAASLSMVIILITIVVFYFSNRMSDHSQHKT